MSKSKCPKCGKNMKKHLMVGPEGIIWYSCSCGYNNKPSFDTISMRAETDLRRSNARAWARMNRKAQDGEF